MELKVALCFIISGNHQLNKEDLWRKWIEPNRDIINVYFHYKNYSQIRSPWIRTHSIPPNEIQPSSYYHVVNAYMALLRHAWANDKTNTWFCLVTESCIPIISPQLFRERFAQYGDKTILRHQRAHWNINFHRRANLKQLPPEYHLSHDPWFILTRKHVELCLRFLITNYSTYRLINKGGLANESLFAIILCVCNCLSDDSVINAVSTSTDWTRGSSPTSPWTFNNCPGDAAVMEQLLKNNPYTMFLRKVDANFPNKVLENVIYETNI